MNTLQVPDFLANIRVVLARPSHPGNIGSVARAMKTMGLTKLYLVSPKRFPDTEATTLAAGAADVLARATIVTNLSQALSDVTVACALTSRRRELTGVLLTPRAVAPQLVAHARCHGKVALVFGNEATGLLIEEVEQCHQVVTIPGNPEYFSLNLAMAVQVMSYELFSHVDADIGLTDFANQAATGQQMEGFFSHLSQTMEQLGYYQHRNSKRLMRRMRSLFQRARLLHAEVDMLRGLLKQIQRVNGRLK